MLCYIVNSTGIVKEYYMTYLKPYSIQHACFFFHMQTTEFYDMKDTRRDRLGHWGLLPPASGRNVLGHWSLLLSAILDCGECRWTICATFSGEHSLQAESLGNLLVKVGTSWLLCSSLPCMQSSIRTYIKVTGCVFLVSPVFHLVRSHWDTIPHTLNIQILICSISSWPHYANMFLFPLPLVALSQQCDRIDDPFKPKESSICSSPL